MRILVVEDEHVLAETIREVLLNQGFEAATVDNGLDGVERGKTGGYDLIILDVMLPGTDGLQVAKRLREAEIKTPILMLTAKAQIEDRIAGLDSGADYYMPKPFDLRELLATINALLRRTSQADGTLALGNTTLDLEKGALSVESETIRLSAREFEVMRQLMTRGENNISKQLLLDSVWGPNSYYSANNVEVYIGFLRKKLSALGSDITIVATRGMGYHLEVQSCKK